MENCRDKNPETRKIERKIFCKIGEPDGEKAGHPVVPLSIKKLEFF
jgi:hypothetical protein